jgi:hypothetical protein
MKENIAFLKTPEAAPGKVIAASPSALQKLADSLAACTAALTTAEREQRDASAILAEACPAGFDHAAAGRALAEARVSDMLNGSATAEGVQQRLDRERATAEAASASHAKRQADARAQVERAGPMLEALRAQAVAIDKALRLQITAFASANAAEAGEELSKSVIAYLEKFINSRALRWLRTVDGYGDKARQFWTPDDEMDLRLSVADDYLDLLPEGWIRSQVPGEVIFKSYVVKRLVLARGTEMMQVATNGLYPKVGADLPRAAADTQAE